ncbi:hypothetical protein BGW42_001711 [Actinomortierella wolfii]|nr:hypothetical protein BGW42_001711 [Actinomortierella wolfii]
MLFKSTIIAVFAAVAALTADAHVAVRYPCPRYGSYKGCPAPPAGKSIDYDLRSPIGVYGAANQPLCKHLTPVPNPPVFKAGQTINFEFDIGAAHGGGHCQFALSYDGGKQWVVIEELIRDCLRGSVDSATYRVPVTIPSNAPSGRVVLQWLWNNAVGNRELYSNCIDMQIEGRNGGSLTGKEPVIINYGSNSHYVGEFPRANDNDGSALFRSPNRKTVTIKVGGGSVEPPKETKPPKPTATKTQKPEPTQPPKTCEA